MKRTNWKRVADENMAVAEQAADAANAAADERDALRAEVWRLKREKDATVRALQFFTNGYPDPEWRYLLHTEGCDGVRLLPGERDENEASCDCDGDEMAAEIDAILAPPPPTTKRKTKRSVA